MRIHIFVPDGTLARIDKARGDIPRSKWVLRAIEAQLAPTRSPNPPRPEPSPADTYRLPKIAPRRTR